MKFLRVLLPAALAVSLTACGSSGSGGLFGNNPIFGGSGQNSQCDTGTSEQLANPQPNTQNSNVNQITIVANGNGNILGQSYQNWSIYVTDAFGGEQIQGGQLTPAQRNGAPAPYGSDFYYSSQLNQTLPSGTTWNVYLTQSNGNNCGAVPLQSFST